MATEYRGTRSRRGEPRATDTEFTAEEVLRGLPSRLVISLARLAGAGRSEMSVTLQLAPFGDRAVMKAYGLISVGPKSKDGSRSLVAEPFCLEVAAAAAELIASIVDPSDVAARLIHDAEEGRLDDDTPYVPAVDESEQQVSGDLLVDAVVQDTEWDGERLKVFLSFGANAYKMSPSNSGGGCAVMTDVDLKPSMNVRVSYPIRDVLRSATLSVPERT